MYDALDRRDVLADELVQRRQSGFDVADLAPEIDRAMAAADVSPDRLDRLTSALEQTRPTPGWPYREAQLDDDWGALVSGHELPRLDVRDDVLADRVLGAWLGRSAGCLLGKPVEGWTAAEIDAYLDAAQVEHLDDYLPRLEPWPSDVPPFKPSWPEATRGRITGMARDDDLDYTVIGLLVLERTAGEPSTDEVAAEWLARMPITKTYTAERAAYRNLVDGVPASLAATVRNPYREWIGALIRVDPYAYVCPGDPWRAAQLAAQDAALSHVGNGVAAAMWAAAVVSMSLAGAPVRDSVSASMACVPPESRLGHALADVLSLYDAGEPWESFAMHASTALAPYGWVHAIPNTAKIAASLLWGAGDFSRTIELAVRAGGDTDSTAATAGSACGALLGASALPRQWVQPLDDTLRTAVAEVATTSISGLAARCLRLAAATRQVSANA